jgi:hypothetical protein
MNLIFEKNPFLYEEPGGMERLGRLGLPWKN